MKKLILERIFLGAPTQRKKISRFFERVPQASNDLQMFLDRYKPFMDFAGISAEQLADSYLEMIDQVIACRLAFLREGKYPAESFAAALEGVYSNKERMTQYMLGLAVSQFLWLHHYRLLEFYRSCLDTVNDKKKFMEVGCGHGLTLLEMFDRVEADASVYVVDISQTSIDLGSGVLKAVDPDLLKRSTFVLKDIYEETPTEKFDFITMGEVLEHVEKPREIMERLREFLAPRGRLYVTTCANCPAIDHIFHFESVPAIRKMIDQAGYCIEKECVAPSEEKSEKDLERFKIDISYAALLAPKEGL